MSLFIGLLVLSVVMIVALISACGLGLTSYTEELIEEIENGLEE